MRIPEMVDGSHLFSDVLQVSSHGLPSSSISLVLAEMELHHLQASSTELSSLFLFCLTHSPSCNGCSTRRLASGVTTCAENVHTSRSL